jgi:hypothetical protein
MNHRFIGALACALTIGASASSVRADGPTIISPCIRYPQLCESVPTFWVSTENHALGAWVRVQARDARPGEAFDIYVDELPGRTAPLSIGVATASGNGAIDYYYDARCWNGASSVPVRAVSRRTGATYQAGYTHAFSC